ncbi:hypothetical protein SAMN05443662_0958 [Sulfurivirga caldicuralii]|uniref:Uncharacterized protein n=1 Tax=Sulfurivirga caldicuralii TaxID=364032 RepID=A0A1N6F7W4_9GAMM|nr:hypothetical protein [Sulfurivirga caldicuralii]SIN91306.1 hypothetical protein SAMN05443662_0958 [Sulfurivirga caldicuralii]
MEGYWAFAWVQIIAHNWSSLGWRFALVSLLIAAGIFHLDISLISETVPWWLASLTVLVPLMAWLFDTRRTAILQGVLSLLILVLMLGGLGWLAIPMQPRDLMFGGVVVLTMLTSNLVHVLGTILREMARGQFQDDAVAEALKHNAAPIILANLTTLLGFWVVAWWSPDFKALAWVVTAGALMSLWVTLTWLPWLLLRYRLEFRVGHYSDRHGFSRLVRWMKVHPSLTRLLGIAGMVALIVANAVVFWKAFESVSSILVMLAVVWLLLWLAWRQVGTATVAVLMNWLAVSLVAALLLVLDLSVSTLAMIVPLGLVIDDAIHFFTRMVRAGRVGLFDTRELRIRFALGSVGRTIWMTSLLVIAALSPLWFSGDPVLQQTILVTALALLVATWLLIVWYPAFLISRDK